jgi:CheY-like chemotaxis protein
MNSDIPTLLIAEDDDNDFTFLEWALKIEKVEAQIRRVHDGVEAIEYLAGEDRFADRDTYPWPNLVILDLKMPRKTGLDVLAWIRKGPEVPNFPIVIFSSSEELSDVENAYNLGVSAFLVKPSSYLAYSGVVTTLKEFLINGSEQPARKRGARTYQKALLKQKPVTG